MRNDELYHYGRYKKDGAPATRRNICDFIEKNKDISVFELNNSLGDRELMLDEILDDYRKHKIT